MRERKLNDYKWVYEKGKITLVNRKTKETMPLKMDKVDSLVRAYISFKNNQRIDEKKVLISRYNVRIEKLLGRIRNLKETIKKLRIKKVDLTENKN